MKKYIYSLMTDQSGKPVDIFVKGLLWVLSLVYGAMQRLIRLLYAIRYLPSYQSNKPVISIGNITVGGAGKTPLVIAAAKILLSKGKKVAILSRGYMSGKDADFSDEARMLKEHLAEVPVMIGRNRRKSIEECLKHHAVDVFLCDDGFQHWPLQRDLDIVAVDAVNPFGNGHLLPRGILREGLDSLARAQIIVLTKTNHPGAKAEDIRRRIGQINSHALIVESKHACGGMVDVFSKTAHDHYHFKGNSVVAFCGIAAPSSFRQSISEAGLNLIELFPFMDHHVYSEEDLAKVRRYALDHQVKVILTTHKDAVKLQNFSRFFEGFHVYYLQVDLEMTYGKNVFIERINSVVRH